MKLQVEAAGSPDVERWGAGADGVWILAVSSAEVCAAPAMVFYGLSHPEPLLVGFEEPQVC